MHVYNPSIWKRQENQEFKIILSNTVSLSPAWTSWDLVSKIQVLYWDWAKVTHNDGFQRDSPVTDAGMCTKMERQQSTDIPT